MLLMIIVPLSLIPGFTVAQLASIGIAALKVLQLGPLLDYFFHSTKCLQNIDAKGQIIDSKSRVLCFFGTFLTHERI